MLVLLVNALAVAFFTVAFRDKKALCVSLCGIPMFATLALRGTYYGPDAAYYYNGFQYISTLNLDGIIQAMNPNILQNAHLVYPFSYESGYALLNWVVYTVGFDYRGFIVIQSFFTVFSFALFSYRYSKDPGFSMFVLSCLSMYLYSFFILRQTFAVCICLFAVPFLLKRKPLPFFLIVLLAFTFHRSAICFAILYPLCGLKISKSVLQTGVVVFLVLIVLSATVLPPVIRWAAIFLSKAYIDFDFAWNNLIALQLFIVACCLFFNVDEVSSDPADNMSLWAILASAITYTLMLNNEVLARANEYLWVFVALLIPAMLHQLEPRMRTLGRMLVGVLLLGYLAYQVQGSALNPYVSVFGVIGGA